MKLRHTLSLFAVGIMLMFSSNASAFDGCGLGGYGYGYLYNSLKYQVPHFAAHPPVYYSHPVARPYGYSPFAYPPNVMTPEIVAESSPVIINNPYVPSTRKTKTEESDQLTSNTTSRPLVIHNPYVSNIHQVAKSSL